MDGFTDKSEIYFFLFCYIVEYCIVHFFSFLVTGH